MNTLLRTDAHSAATLPGSQRQAELHLAAAQAPLALPLRAWQSRTLRVSHGCLWLTEQGKPDDVFIQAGQQMHLLGPARFYLSAAGAAGVRLSLT